MAIKKIELHLLLRGLGKRTLITYLSETVRSCETVNTNHSVVRALLEAHRINNESKGRQLRLKKIY